ncbi:MAG: PspA/IM30 family protein [Candidatus Tectomicrobia bacterium]|nr:PspA/IM30 family protein [Candidatus Tectomicrobia bacterium]
MGIFSRLFKVGQAEAHSVVNKLEDPIRMTEQGIRDLKRDLQGAMQGLAEVKGVALRMSKEGEDAKRQASEYERKAMLLLQRAQDGQLDMAEAERLATEALAQKDTVSERATRLLRDAEQQQRMSAQLQEKVLQLKSTITTHENELVTLRARAKTAESTKKINQQLAKIDSSSTISMLERMKNKVEEDEALAQAYGEVADADASVDAEIDRALAGSQTAGAQDRLAELKTRMGLTS